MYPLIKNGDSLCIKFCPPQSIKIGDIAAFRRGESTIVHRIIKKTDNGFLEKGDLQIRAEPVELERIMGKVVMMPVRVNALMAFLGCIIHRLGSMRFPAKFLLLIPLTINAGTRAFNKLR